MRLANGNPKLPPLRGEAEAQTSQIVENDSLSRVLAERAAAAGEVAAAAEELRPARAAAGACLQHTPPEAPQAALRQP
ncbi:hypothetical protein GCM10023157_26020 [Gluconacetobacter asukensis]